MHVYFKIILIKKVDSLIEVEIYKSEHFEKREKYLKILNEEIHCGLSGNFLVSAFNFGCNSRN